MHSESDIEVSREVEAIQIPSGDTIKIPAGTKVRITQSLGGTYTVATDYGLARISSRDKDALGMEDKAGATSAASGEKLTGEALEQAVWGQLKEVYDPEIPVNIVDLGLVYDCQLTGDEGAKVVEVKMTLTAPGCGMGPTIAADAQSRVMTINGIEDAKVELVWDPPWNQDMISEEGRMRLGMV
ncbi:MAG: putative Fe-S cluster assembly protein SufT [Verrucomicrobiales bacterium]